MFMLSLFTLRGITPVQHSERRRDAMLPAMLLPLAAGSVRSMVAVLAEGFVRPMVGAGESAGAVSTVGARSADFFFFCMKPNDMSEL